MNDKLYIRFSNDIYEDIDGGYSYFKGGSKLAGLCAWTTPFFSQGRSVQDYNGNDISDDEIEAYAQSLVNNTYGSYSDNSEFHLVVGDYVANGNDGVLLKNVRVVESFNF